MDIKKIQETKPILELLDFSIINIDKPSGPTSFKVCEKIRNILNAKKTGHFGTLDPKVTGVLPISLNKACRLSNYFMKKEKEYVGKMYLHKDISLEELKKEMEKFTGKIMQKPPKKSRVKRVLRERNVNNFEIIKKEDKFVEFNTNVEAGTYIRKLISDLGEKIGGAHMVELRRTRAGIFHINDSVTLEMLENSFENYKNGNEKELRNILIPGEIIKDIITPIQVKDECVKLLLNGKPLMNNDIGYIFQSSELISVFNKERFIGIYRIIKDKDIIAKAEFVFN